MNKKHYNNVDNVSFTLTHDYGQKYQLTSTPIGPIGKMPGTINVNAQIEKDQDGNLSTTSFDESAGTLKLSKGGTLKIYMSNISGRLEGDSINFILDTYSVEILGIKAVNASVTFKGARVSN